MTSLRSFAASATTLFMSPFTRVETRMRLDSSILPSRRSRRSTDLIIHWAYSLCWGACRPPLPGRQLTQPRGAVHPWHHGLHDDEIRVEGGRLLERLQAVLGGLYLVAFPVELGGKKRKVPFVVIYGEYAGLHLAAPPTDVVLKSYSLKPQ